MFEHSGKIRYLSFCFPRMPAPKGAGDTEDSLKSAARARLEHHGHQDWAAYQEQNLPEGCLPESPAKSWISICTGPIS